MTGNICDTEQPGTIFELQNIIIVTANFVSGVVDGCNIQAWYIDFSGMQILLNHTCFIHLTLSYFLDCSERGTHRIDFMSQIIELHTVEGFRLRSEFALS